MTKVFDEKNGYLSEEARRIIDALNVILGTFSNEVVSTLQDAEIPEPEWNLFMLYYKEHVYTTLLEEVTKKRLANQTQAQLSSKL